MEVWREDLSLQRPAVQRNEWRNQWGHRRFVEHFQRLDSCGRYPAERSRKALLQRISEPGGAYTMPFYCELCDGSDTDRLWKHKAKQLSRAGIFFDCVAVGAIHPGDRKHTL